MDREVDMYKGVTSSGFEYEIDEKNADNMELVDAVSDVTEGDKLAVSRVCRLILGVDQRKRLYEHLRTEDGRVPVEAVTREIFEIFNGTDSGKK